MFEKIIYAGVVFVGFIAIMNPISAIPIFLTLTGCADEDTTKLIAFRATLTAFLIVVLFSVAGHLVLQLFNVSFTALRLTGGILVVTIGYDMLNGKLSAVSQPLKEAMQKPVEVDTSVAITPLGIPLLAGPGVIITAMNFASSGYINLIITICSFGVLCSITYYALIYGKKIKKILGASVLKVITSMMGLILAVIGMQMIIQGVYEVGNHFCK